MDKRVVLATFIVIGALAACTKPAENTTSADTTAATSDDSSMPEAESESGPETYVVSARLLDEPTGRISGDSLGDPSTNVAGLDFFGFSEDGKYCGFSAITPGETVQGTARAYFIEVAKNEWATKPVERMFDSEPDSVMADSIRILSAEAFKKFGLKVKGPDNLGQIFTFEQEPFIYVEQEKYRLDLQTPDMLMNLRLMSPNKIQVLQKDTKIPKSRGEVTRYALHSAYVLGDKIAVFIEYDGPEMRDYENYPYRDRNFLLVTAVVKL